MSVCETQRGRWVKERERQREKKGEKGEGRYKGGAGGRRRKRKRKKEESGTLVGQRSVSVVTFGSGAGSRPEYRRRKTLRKLCSSLVTS